MRGGGVKRGPMGQRATAGALGAVIALWCFQVGRGAIGTRAFEQAPDSYDGVEQVLSLVNVIGGAGDRCRVQQGTLALDVLSACPGTAELTVRGHWDAAQQAFVVAELWPAPARGHKMAWSLLGTAMAFGWAARALRRTPTGLALG